MRVIDAEGPCYHCGREPSYFVVNAVAFPVTVSLCVICTDEMMTALGTWAIDHLEAAGYPAEMIALMREAGR